LLPLILLRDRTQEKITLGDRGDTIAKKPASGRGLHSTFAIGYLCADFEGTVTPDENQAIEDGFFKLNQVPEDTNPFIKKKLVELKIQFEIG
jgi:hypothetical protein